jgi:hypothetical protein
VYFNQEIESCIDQFLANNRVAKSAVELVLHAGSIPSNIGQKQIEYQQYTGLYYSSSAFAMHLANDFNLSSENYALIVNHQQEGKLGLTLLQ